MNLNNHYFNAQMALSLASVSLLKLASVVFFHMISRVFDSFLAFRDEKISLLHLIHLLPR